MSPLKSGHVFRHRAPLLAACALAASLVACDTGGPSEVTRVDTADRGRVATGAAQEPAPADWPDGTEWSYALSVKSRVGLHGADSLLGFELSGHKMELYGRCAQCQKTKRAGRP